MYALPAVFLSLAAVGYGLFNCTRYQQPCLIEATPTCCGYPLFDCISDGVDTSCQSLNDFPELEAEFVMRVREAKDRGQSDITLEEVRKDVNGLLGTQGQNGTATTRRPFTRGERRTTERNERRSGRLERPAPRPVYANLPRRRQLPSRTGSRATTSRPRTTESTTTTEEDLAE